MEHNLSTIIKGVGRAMLLAVPLLTIATFSSCNSEENVSVGKPQLNRLSFNATVEDDNPATRGEKALTLEEAFGLFGYTYDASWNNGNGKKPNWLCDQEVNTTADGGWATTALVDMDAAKAKFQFFSYYPYLHEEFSAEEEYKYLTSMPTYDPETGIGTLGNPTFTFVTNDSAINQNDFLVGVALEKQKETLLDAPVDMKFKHALAGVLFKVGTITEEITISKITLTNVKKTGTLTVTATNPDDAAYATAPYTTATYTWTSLRNVGNVEVEPAFTVAGDNSDAGQVINSNELVMFLIPQELPDDARIIVELSNGLELSSTINTSTTKAQLVRGKMTTFTLSVTSISKLDITTNIENWGDGGSYGGDITDGNSIVPASDIEDWGDGGETTSGATEEPTPNP